MTGYLQVNKIGKAYKQYFKRWGRLVEWCSFGKLKSYRRHWVLQDISFDIQPGEAVGIIGKNGAGKSTLLKLITGTTRPTTGEIKSSGKIAALLELGMGFHPDFTGRQNVFMAGQLLGYSAQEIAARFSEIEDFAELGSYMDQPLRVYSSGMQVRLAFSVSTAIRPDILIVDEALSVGDIFFQQKCFQRITEFKKQGTTLLFVSHDLGAINNICDRVIFIKNSKVSFDGRPDQAINFYEADLLTKIDANPERLIVNSVQSPVTPSSTNCENATQINVDNAHLGSINTHAIRLLDVKVLSEHGQATDVIVSDSEVTLLIKISFLEEFDDPHIGFKIRDRLGAVIFETNSFCMNKTIGKVLKGETVAVGFKFKAGFVYGDYTITIGIANGGYSRTEFREVLGHYHGIAKITVLKNNDAIIWAGIYNVAPVFTIMREESKVCLNS